MKKKKIAILIIVTLCVLVGVISPSYAYIYNRENTVKGLRNIQPNDKLNFPDNTVWASLTAVWGVRVEFIDYDESIIKSEVIEVSDEQKGTTVIPKDPIRKNYKFTGWTRYDENSGMAFINDDGTLSDICGPGPIIYIANYQIVDDNYKVNYVVEEDDDWGSPDESITPIDNNSYVYNDTVKVLSSDESLKGYAVDSENGKKIPGTWKFKLDEENNPELNEENEFKITENTEVKGSWTFTPDPVKLKYNVIKDEVWGEPTDSEVKSSETEHEYKEKVKVSGSIAPYKGTALDKELEKEVSGTWEFKLNEESNPELNEENEFNITENTEVKGSWTFVPDKLRVEYITKDDEVWGKPLEDIIPTDYDLYNYKDNVNIINKERVFEGTATDLKTGKKVSGKWELVVDGLDTIITENMTINAQWKFTPNTVNNPKTGDNLYIYILLFCFSLIALIIIGISIYKSRFK